jgi:hypothetical protein
MLSTVTTLPLPYLSDQGIETALSRKQLNASVNKIATIAG